MSRNKTDNTGKQIEKVSLFVNGKKVPLLEFVQDALAGTVTGFINSLKFTQNVHDIELRIKLDEE